MIRAAFILCMLGLAACGPGGGSGAFTESRLPPGLPTHFWAPEGWAWGLVEVKGKPVMRYGVAAPVGKARADIIILPGYGESAEGWFETANALIAAGYTVWILEGAGQGGSGRYGPRREVGHAPDFEADIAGLVALDRLVVGAKGPVALIASGTSDLTALAAIGRGYAPAVAILSGPLPTLPHRGPWERPRPDDKLTPRRRAAASWALANPDLRLGGPSRSWLQARNKLQEAVLAKGLATGARPVLLITQDPDRLSCNAQSGCQEVMIPSAESYPFSGEQARTQWLAAILSHLPR